MGRPQTGFLHKDRSYFSVPHARSYQKLSTRWVKEQIPPSPKEAVEALLGVSAWGMPNFPGNERCPMKHFILLGIQLASLQITVVGSMSCLEVFYSSHASAWDFP